MLEVFVPTAFVQDIRLRSVVLQDHVLERHHKEDRVLINTILSSMGVDLLVDAKKEVRKWEKGKVLKENSNH